MAGDAHTIYEADWDRAWTIGEAQTNFQREIVHRIAECKESLTLESVHAKFADEKESKHEEIRDALTMRARLNVDRYNSPGSLLDDLHTESNVADGVHSVSRKGEHVHDHAPPHSLGHVQEGEIHNIPKFDGKKMWHKAHLEVGAAVALQLAAAKHHISPEEAAAEAEAGEIISTIHSNDSKLRSASSSFHSIRKFGEENDDDLTFSHACLQTRRAQCKEPLRRNDGLSRGDTTLQGS